MITAEVTAAARQQLQLAADAAGGCVELVLVEALGNPAEEQGARAKKRFDSVYTKLGVWGLTDYETVVFLDADMIVLRNVRHPLPARPCPLPSPGPDETLLLPRRAGR